MSGSKGLSRQQMADRIARAFEDDVGREVAARDNGGQRGLEQGNDLLFLLGEHELWSKI